jgi:transcriptional regulator with XRE-family HTH domain
MNDLGKKLKQLRLKKNLTQKNLAEKIHCTSAYICQLENGKADPSLSTLKKIATALDITIIDFFRTQYEEKVVVKSTEREVFTLTQSKTTIATLVPNPGTKKIDARLAVVAPGGGSEGAYHHEGEEFGYLIRGELVLLYNGEIFHLKEGDSFYLHSRIGHEYQNRGREEAVVLWVNHPPTF